MKQTNLKPIFKLRSIFFISLVVITVSCILFSFRKSPSQQIHPNLIILIADQWRGQSLGFLHEDPVMTPHLDSLAQHSLVLKNFISNYPVCSSARGMLMTGQYPLANHGYDNVETASEPYGVQLSTDAICWSDVLKQNGYSLGYIGKWHLDSPHPPYIPTSNNEGKVKWNEWTPPNRRHGFDYWYSYGTYDEHLHPMYWDTDAGRMDFHYVDEWEPQHDVDKAIEFLGNKNGKFRKEDDPFGLVVSMNPPHTDYRQVPAKYYDLYKNIPIDSFLKDPDIPPTGTTMGNAYRRDIKYYDAAITGVDEQIGRLMAALKQNGLDENTVVLFISDHGNCLGKHSQITKNNIYEESLRVPFILYWKGHVLPAIDSKCLLSYPDIYPTLLSMMGMENKIPKTVQGKSYASYMLNRKGAFPQQQFFMGNITAPDLKTGFRGVRTQEYKLAYFKKNVSDSLHSYLFDLKKDPFEMNNLYGQFPVIKKNLESKLVKWLRKNKDPFVQLINLAYR